MHGEVGLYKYYDYTELLKLKCHKNIVCTSCRFCEGEEGEP
jgi:hypothetical protein